MKKVQTRNIWIGLAVCGAVYMALNALDSHAVWYFTICGLGLARVFRMMPMWCYPLFGVVTGGVACAAAACTALKGKAAGIVFSAVNLLLALALLAGAIGSGSSVMIVGMLFWLLISVMQLIYSFTKKNGAVWFVIALIFTVVSLAFSLALTCIKGNFFSDAYRWVGFGYWRSPRFLSSTLFGGKHWLMQLTGAACALFPLSRAALMGVMTLGFLRFGKTVTVAVEPVDFAAQYRRPEPFAENGGYAAAGMYAPGTDPAEGPYAPEETGYAQGEGRFAQEETAFEWKEGPFVSEGIPFEQEEGMFAAEGIPFEQEEEPFVSEGTSFVRKEIPDDSTEVPFAQTMSAEDTRVSGIAPTMVVEEVRVSGIEPTMSAEDVRVSGIEPTMAVEEAHISGIKPTMSAEDIRVSVTAPMAAAENPIEALRLLGTLREQGVLSEEEFLKKKAELLSRM